MSRLSQLALVLASGFLYLVPFAAWFTYRAMQVDGANVVWAVVKGLIVGAFAFPFIVALLSVLVAVLPFPKVPLSYNIRNLEVRWITSLFTSLAFTLVISVLMVMLAFVKGMEKMTEGSGVPGNVMILADGANDEAFSSLPASAGVQSLPSDLQAAVMKNDKGQFLFVKEVFVIVTNMVPHPKPGAPKRRFVQMRGLDDVALAAQVHQLELAEGEFPSPGGVRKITRVVDGSPIEETAPEIVLGDGMSRLFAADTGASSMKPGDVIEIGPRRWYVSGIMKANSSTFGSEIWAQDTPVAQNFGRINSYSSYVVRTKNDKTAELAAKLVTDFRSTPAMQAQSERAYFASLNATNEQFTYAVYFIAGIMAIGGIFGVMNTMFAAISQRTKDIGVLRLLGFTRWQILCSFLLESLVIGLVGGLIGMALTLPFNGLTVNSIVSGGQGGGKSIVFRITADAFVYGVGFIFTIFMASLGGLIPCLSAMRLKPLESLR